MILLIALSGAHSQGLGSDAYAGLVDLFALDPNQGLTVFLSTLVPMGGLAESMGMAYTALTLDSSFLEINPAASSVLEKTELSLYHNSWIQDTRIEGLVYALRFGRFGFAVGGKWLYLPFTERDDFGERVSSGYYSEMIGIANASVHLFPGYYFFGMALGGNFKLAYRSMPDYGDANGVLIPGSGASQSALGIMADFGILSKFNIAKFYASRDKNFSVGLAVKNLGPPVLDEALNTVATVGLAYNPFRPVTFSLDFSMPLNLVDLSKSEYVYFGAGTLVRITDMISMHGGFLLKGSNPRISLGTSVDFSLMSLIVNWTVDLSTQISPLNRLSVQARFDMGDMGRADMQRRIDELYIKGLEAYAKGEIEVAIAYWRDVIALDSSFDPARESLDGALKALELRQRVLDIQRLD